MSDTVTKANRDINSLQPVAQRAARLFLDECKKRGIDIFVTEYHRSQARQDYLYCQGRTVSQCVNAGIPKNIAEKYCRSGSKVTWTRSSNHTAGYAWDIAVNPPHDLYDFSIIKKAAEVAKELGIEWGGNWLDSRDTPHFQVNKNWKEPIKKDEEYEKAILVLEEKININRTAWLPKPNPKNLPSLISKIGLELYGTNNYVFTINRMKQDGIISNEVLWLEHEYNESHIKSLIKKVRNVLG